MIKKKNNIHTLNANTKIGVSYINTYIIKFIINNSKIMLGFDINTMSNCYIFIRILFSIIKNIIINNYSLLNTHFSKYISFTNNIIHIYYYIMGLYLPTYMIHGISFINLIKNIYYILFNNEFFIEKDIISNFNKFMIIKRIFHVLIILFVLKRFNLIKLITINGFFFISFKFFYSFIKKLIRFTMIYLIYCIQILRNSKLFLTKSKYKRIGKLYKYINYIIYPLFLYNLLYNKLYICTLACKFYMAKLNKYIKYVLSKRTTKSLYANK